MCSIVYEPCDDNSFKIGPSILGGGGGSAAAILAGNKFQSKEKEYNKYHL